MARARGRVQQQQRASFIGLASNKPHTFGKPQETENSRGLRFLRNQEPVIKFSRIWTVEGKPRERWRRGTRTEKLGREIQSSPGEGRDWRKLGQGGWLRKELCWPQTRAAHPGKPSATVPQGASLQLPVPGPSSVGRESVLLMMVTKAESTGRDRPSPGQFEGATGSRGHARGIFVSLTHFLPWLSGYKSCREGVFVSHPAQLMLFHSEGRIMHNQQLLIHTFCAPLSVQGYERKSDWPSTTS